MVVGGCLESANWSSNHPREFGVLLRIDFSDVHHVLVLLLNEGYTAFLEESEMTKKMVISCKRKREGKGKEKEQTIPMYG